MFFLYLLLKKKIPSYSTYTECPIFLKIIMYCASTFTLDYVSDTKRNKKKWHGYYNQLYEKENIVMFKYKPLD